MGEKLLVWERRDDDATTFQTVQAGGPEWKLVVRRVTRDSDTGLVISDELVRGVTDDVLYRLLDKTRNINTTFYHEPPPEDEAIVNPNAPKPTHDPNVLILPSGNVLSVGES